MKHFYLSLALISACVFSQAQNFSLAELLDLTHTNHGKFQQFASKRGFQTEAVEKDFIRMQYNRDSNRLSFLSRQWNNEGGWLRMEKLTQEEYQALKKSIEKAGYQNGNVPGKVQTEIFEKPPMVITASAEVDLENGKLLYNIVVQQRRLPRSKEIQFAEDLLLLDSHLQLQYVFGEKNVVKDEYLLPDGSSMPCSVIYPQSSAEAVFVWKDKTNFRTLECLRVGGISNTRKSLDYNYAVQQNQWRSRQGIYPNMTLDRLCVLNEAALKFYGWGAYKSGSLYPDTKGKLDFSQLTLVLSCLNCNDGKYYGDKPHSAEEAINDYRRIHVATVVLKPKPAL